MNAHIRRVAEDSNGGASSPGASAPKTPPTESGMMKWVRWGLLVVFAVLAVVTVGGYVVSQRGAGQSGQTNVSEAMYQCPMHPTYTSNDPDGECPICGMDLEPVNLDEGPDHGAGSGDGDVPGLVGVHLSAERTQMIGVRTALVEKRALGATMELVAFVTPDESRLKRVQLRVAGWVQSLNVSRTGERVQVGQPLLSLYSPELYQSEEEFLIELRAGDPNHAASGSADAARERLRLLGVPKDEIDRLEREKKATTHLTLRSPVTGTVLERGVTEGQYVGPNTLLLTLADLSRVWLLVDMYEMDLARVKVGDRAVFTTDAMPGQTFEGKVEFVYPTVSVETRTVKARVSLANKNGDIRPGMYGNVRLYSRTKEALSIPTEALVQTGQHDYVFIVHEGGHFEPRMVWLGDRDSDRVEVTRGLEEGERIVASAAFLIDSESRLKAAIAGIGAEAAAGHQH